VCALSNFQVGLEAGQVFDPGLVIPFDHHHVFVVVGVRGKVESDLPHVADTGDFFRLIARLVQRGKQH